DEDLAVKREEALVLPVILRAELPAAEDHDHRVQPLQARERSVLAGLVGELEVGEHGAGDDVCTHAPIFAQARAGASLPYAANASSRATSSSTTSSCSGFMSTLRRMRTQAVPSSPRSARRCRSAAPRTRATPTKTGSAARIARSKTSWLAASISAADARRGA